MDSTIIAAIIGATGSIIAATITLIVATRKQQAAPHSSLRDAPLVASHQRQTEATASASIATAHEPLVEAAASNSEGGIEYSADASKEKPGMTFDEVIQAIRRQAPDAILGRTAEQGQYFERAKHLTNYQIDQADPPWSGAVQTNGKTMWIYLGKGRKICCGDKE